MTRQENIEKIRAACIAANPEIAEREKRSHLKGVLDAIRVTSQPIYGHTDPNSVEDCWLEIFENEELLFGRPIRLADVLLAIEANWKVAGEYAIDCDGSFMQHFDAKGFTEEHWRCRKESWGLRADDLTQQSDETLAFITSLV